MYRYNLFIKKKTLVGSHVACMSTTTMLNSYTFALIKIQPCRSEVYQPKIANQFLITQITEQDNAIRKRKRWGSELPQQTFFVIYNPIKE